MGACQFPLLPARVSSAGGVEVSALSASFVSCLCQVSPAAGEWSDSGVHSGPVLQAEIQPAAEIPSPTLSAGWPGAEAHVPALGGECWLRTAACPASGHHAKQRQVALVADVLWAVVASMLTWQEPLLVSEGGDQAVKHHFPAAAGLVPLPGAGCRASVPSPQLSVSFCP